MARAHCIFIDCENVSESDLSRVSGKAVRVFMILGTLSTVTDSGTGRRTATVTASTEVFPACRGYPRIKISE